MALEKDKEIFSQGKLVGELFRKEAFLGLATKEGVFVRNLDYHFFNGDLVNHVFIPGSCFPEVGTGLDDRLDIRDSLWGVTDDRGPSRFCQPDDPDERIKPYKLPEGAVAFKIKKAGPLVLGLYRFHLVLEDDVCKCVLGEGQIPLLEETLVTQIERKSLYSNACEALSFFVSQYDRGEPRHFDNYFVRLFEKEFMDRSRARW